MYRNNIRTILEKAVRESFDQKDLQELFPVYVEVCNNEDYGDYSSPIALRIANRLGLDGAAVANTIVGAIEHLPPFCQSVRAQSSGFINITIARDAIYYGLMAVLNRDRNFAAPDLGEKRKVRVVAADTSSSSLISVFDGRLLMLAAFLKRLFRAAGYDASLEGFVRETGETLWFLGKFLESRYRELFGDDGEYFYSSYGSRRIIEITKRIIKEDGASFLTVTKPQRIGILREKAVKKILSDLKKIFSQVKMECKTWVSSVSFSERGGLFSELADIFKKSGLLYEEQVIPYNYWVCSLTLDSKQVKMENKARYNSVEPDYIYWGSPETSDEQQRLPETSNRLHNRETQVWLRSTAFGDSEDRILFLPNGEPSDYFSHLAYIIFGIKNGFVRNIFIKSSEIAMDFYSKYAKALEYLGYNPDYFEVLAVSGVSVRGLSEEQEQLEGDFAGLESLISRLPKDSLSLFYFLKSINQVLDIDCGKNALDDLSNPYHSLSRALSRINGILNMVQGKKIQHGKFDLKDVKTLLGEREEALIRCIIRYPSAFCDSVTNCSPTILTRYILSLAQDFNDYYDSVQIFSGEKDVIKERIAVAKACKIIMEKALHIVGIKL